MCSVKGEVLLPIEMDQTFAELSFTPPGGEFKLTLGHILGVSPESFCADLSYLTCFNSYLCYSQMSK